MITHDHKLIFVHVPKCAGRSVSDLFSQRFDHFTARYYEREYRLFWERYFKFTIVRNPFARLVSIYTYTKQHRRHSLESISTLSKHSGSSAWPFFKEWVIANMVAYNDTVDMFPKASFSRSPEGLRGYDGIVGSPFWFTSQYQRIISDSGEIKLDAMFRMEDGLAEVDTFISKMINKTVQLPHRNKSGEMPYKSYYDPELVEIVTRWAPIAEDCKMLNYKY